MLCNSTRTVEASVQLYFSSLLVSQFLQQGHISNGGDYIRPTEYTSVTKLRCFLTICCDHWEAVNMFHAWPPTQWGRSLAAGSVPASWTLEIKRSRKTKRTIVTSQWVKFRLNIWLKTAAFQTQTYSICRSVTAVTKVLMKQFTR